MLEGLGRYGEAITFYDQALAAFPQLTTTIQPRRAQAFVALGDRDSAAAAYRAAADAAGDTVQKVVLLEALGSTYSIAGRFAEAVATYDEILSVARNPGYRAQIQYQAGETLALAGDLPNAIRAAGAPPPTKRLPRTMPIKHWCAWSSSRSTLTSINGG